MAPTNESVLIAWTLFLPHIEVSRHMAHQLIARIPTDVLAIRPVAEGESIGELAWTVASSYDVLLSGLCDGQFPALPAIPAEGTAASFVAWDQNRFPAKLQQAASLSADELLRPLTLAPVTQPAIQFLPLFIASVSQHLGVLSAWLQQHMPAPAASGELSDADLANVAGGTTGWGPYGPVFAPTSPIPSSPIPPISGAFGNSGTLTSFSFGATPFLFNWGGGPGGASWKI